jgi:hypothetical protein
MKQIWITLIATLMTVNLYSQKMENDTLIGKRFVKSPWAIKIESGAILHQMFNPGFIDNKATQISDLTVFYRNFYFTYGAFIYDFTPNKVMVFDDVTVNTQHEFSSLNLNVALGYSYDFHKNWSTDIKIGFNSTSFEISNSNETNLIYESDLIMGAQIGLGLDRYIKLKRYNYIVIGLGLDYYTTDYSKISPHMKPSSLNYSLTIGYKGFFQKMID